MDKPSPDPPSITCSVCRRQVLADSTVRVAAVPQEIVTLASSARDARICNECLATERLRTLTSRLQAERGELSALEAEVARAAAAGTTIAGRLSEEFASRATSAQRLADSVAQVGGSWRFVMSALLVIAVWMTGNALMPAGQAFDPYPFILLNLVLSCLAALQAPIILMSQNRSAARDRAQADQDFLVNLKAELEVSGLDAKLDHLLHTRWEDLLLMQQVQLDLLTQLQKDLARLREGGAAGGSGGR